MKENKIIKIEHNKNIEDKKISEKLKNKEIKFAYFAVDGNKSYRFYDETNN